VGAHPAGTALSGYPVPAGEAQAELQCRNSRFVGTAGETPTVAAARAFIARIRARHPEADHHVYAFAVGYGASVTHGMSDDGEPPGTAGRPVLAALRGADLGDVTVVVARYFGGTKLGTGGLARAYAAVARATLAATRRTRRIDTCPFVLEVGYDHYAPCRRVLAELGASVDRETFGDTVAVRGRCPTAHFEQLAAAVGGITGGRARLARGA